METKVMMVQFNPDFINIAFTEAFRKISVDYVELRMTIKNNTNTFCVRKRFVVVDQFFHLILIIIVATSNITKNFKKCINKLSLQPRYYTMTYYISNYQIKVKRTQKLQIGILVKPQNNSK